MRIRCFDLQDLSAINHKLIAFDQQFEDFSVEWWLEADHTRDYANYFTKLRFNIESPLFFIAQHEGQIEGVMVVVLQQLPHTSEKAWYLCDLKISPDAHNLSILVGFVRALKEKCSPICDKAYAFAMENGTTRNRVVQFAMSCAGFRSSGELGIECIQSFEQLETLKQSYPDALLVSPGARQTIIVNNQPMNLFHVVKSNHNDLASTLTALPLNNLPKTFFNTHAVLSVTQPPMLNTWRRCVTMHKGLDHMNWDWVSTFDM